ncbi:MAG: FAD synthetase family protein [Chlamydiota bacterium]
MNIYTSIPKKSHSTALTIGFFDGVHLGHQNLIQALRETGEKTTVLTFSNPPWQVFKPGAPLNLLTSFSLKLALLEKYGVDAVIALPFTREFASTSYEDLLSQFTLSHLILGIGSEFGKNREGNAANVQNIALQKGFKVQYISKTIVDGEIVSSSRIRQYILSNQLAKAERLLGRPYALLFPPGRQMMTQDLCLPPDGIYPVRIDELSDQLEIKTVLKERSLTLSRTYPNQFLINFDSIR